MHAGVPGAARRVPQPRHASLATLALILGGVAIGTTEFVTMGLLPDIAAGVGVDIPTAGHTISAYAAGVVIGAPLLALLAATWPRKALLIGLMRWADIACGERSSLGRSDDRHEECDEKDKASAHG